MISKLSHIVRRRRALGRSIHVKEAFEQWEESCVPSYLHGNALAAFVSWERLFVAAKLANHLKPRPCRVLDFGSSVGELSNILQYDGDYEFVEIDDASATFLEQQNNLAVRIHLEDAPLATYDLVFAIDSLEHNTNYGQLLSELSARLATDGVLILSGPTENFLYRLGRRIAGFTGEYHHTTIFDIERQAAMELRLIGRRTVPFGLPLFRVTAWKRLTTTFGTSSPSPQGQLPRSGRS